MESKIVSGYCEFQESDYSIEIKILESDTFEGTNRNYGTFKCPYRDSCNLPECSVLKSNNIRVGDSL